MRIIPAIDLKQGQVVHAVGGNRGNYRPIQSEICDGADPGVVGRALADQFQPPACYVADLDAIAGAEPAWRDYRDLAACNFALWIDAGLDTRDRAAEINARADTMDAQIDLVAGLESLSDPLMLRDLVELVGAERLLFSLDLRQGNPITTIASWQSAAPIEIAETAIEFGIGRMIVLDVARVGGRRGTGTESICRAIRRRAPAIKLSAGGGLRDAADISRLADAGCDFAIVATALHRRSGRALSRWI